MVDFQKHDFFGILLMTVAIPEYETSFASPDPVSVVSERSYHCGVQMRPGDQGLIMLGQPATPSLPDKRVLRAAAQVWSALQDLNLRPLPCEGSALPLS